MCLYYTNNHFCQNLNYSPHIPNSYTRTARSFLLIFCQQPVYIRNVNLPVMHSVNPLGVTGLTTPFYYTLYVRTHSQHKYSSVCTIYMLKYCYMHSRYTAPVAMSCSDDIAMSQCLYTIAIEASCCHSSHELNEHRKKW